MLVKAVEDAEEKCLPVLEEMAAALQTERAGDALPQVYMNLTPDLSEDWDFMVSSPPRVCYFANRVLDVGYLSRSRKHRVNRVVRQ